MRLRKNLRIWATLFAICLCFVVFVNVGEQSSSKATCDIKSITPTQSQNTGFEKNDANQATSPKDAEHASSAIFGYTSDVNQDTFKNTAIIGNSFVDDLEKFQLIKAEAFFSYMGLNVETFQDYSNPAKFTEIHSAISQSNYKNIVFVFGQTEMDLKPKDFETLISETFLSVAASQPNARFFVCATTPVSKEVSDNQIDGITMDKINTINEILHSMAELINAEFVDSTELFVDSDGFLLEGASSDGIHLEYKYCKAWVNYLAKQVEYK